MKDLINKINFIASIGFGGLGIYLLIQGQTSLGFQALGLSVFLLLTVLIYSLFVHMKKQAHKTVATIFYVSKFINKNDEDSIHKNKIMNIVFLIDCYFSKNKKQTLTGSAWSWANHNPINPIVSSFFNSNIQESSVIYSFSEEEKNEMNLFLLEVQNLSKIELDKFMFEKYPSLLNAEENKIINFEKI